MCRIASVMPVLLSGWEEYPLKFAAFLAFQPEIVACSVGRRTAKKGPHFGERAEALGYGAAECAISALEIAQCSNRHGISRISPLARMLHYNRLTVQNIIRDEHTGWTGRGAVSGVIPVCAHCAIARIDKTVRLDYTAIMVGLGVSGVKWRDLWQSI